MIYAHYLCNIPVVDPGIILDYVVRILCTLYSFAEEETFKSLQKSRFGGEGGKIMS